MKTTKKGFTLIELIVVIAIIGVLAAILVPAMLGYVKKSKIQGANADAKTFVTNANVALEEMDEEGHEPTFNGWTGKLTADPGSAEELYETMAIYSDKAKAENFSLYVEDGVVRAGVAKNGKYYGTYPSILTNKNYGKDYMKKNDLTSAQAAAEIAAGIAAGSAAGSEKTS